MNDDLKDFLQSIGQEHLLAFEASLDGAGRQCLRDQIRSLDLLTVAKLYREARSAAATPTHPSTFEPIEALELGDSNEVRSAAIARGESAIADGRVAALVVAGGQGTRLGFDLPKGIYPIGPVSGASLFQKFAEQIRYWKKRTGARIPWYVLTSDANHEDTTRYFAENRYFGLGKADVRFFVQGCMPAVDWETGRVLLDQTGRVFTSPNGHGGVLLALKTSGMLDEILANRMDLVSYFQIDNPMLKAIDPLFLGYHLLREAQASVKVVRRTDPNESVGLVVRENGRPTVVEYSDPKAAGLKEQRDGGGGLRYWGANIAAHVFDAPFLRQITSGELALPFHFARKSAPFVDRDGVTRSPMEKNALKFELFVFDALPLARQVAVLEVDRQEEFWPVKNATGVDSADTCRQAITRQAADWLAGAGVVVPGDVRNSPGFALEISPGWGSAKEFAQQLTDRDRVRGPKYYPMPNG